MPKWKADALIEKKKKEEEAKKTGASSKPQSSVSSVSKNSTFLGGGSSVKKTEERVKGPSEQKQQQIKENTTRRTQTTTGPQRQTDTGTGRRTLTRTEARDYNNNLKQTQIRRSKADAKESLNRTDDFVRRTTARAGEWEKENLSARNPMLETQRTVKNQKAGERAAERFQERFEKQEPSERQKAFTDYTSGVIQRKALGYAKTASDLLKTNEGYKAQGRWAQEDPEFARKISSHEFAQRADKAFNDYSVKQEQIQKRLNKIEDNASGAGKVALQAYGSGLEMGIDRLAGPMWAASMFASAYGNQRGQALKEGASDEQDSRAAFLGAGVEVATEYMFKPVAGIASKFGGKHSLDFAGKLAAKVTGKLTGNKARIADIAIRTLGSQVEEGLEEVAGWAVNPYIQNAAYKNDLQKQKTAEAHADYEDMQRSFWNQFDTEEEAQQAALYVNSKEFIDDQVKTYKESGATDKEARSMARILQKYFLAHFDNDEESAEEAEAEMDRFVVGDIREKHDWKELGQTLASTFLLTGVTGGASVYYTNQIGNQMLQGEVGKDRVKQYTDIVIKYDPDNAKDAKYVKDTIDRGGTPTGTQVYQVASQATEVLQDMGKREMASNQVKQRRMRDEDLRVPPVAMTARGPQFNEETAKAYQASYDKALGVVRGVRKHGTDVGLSEDTLTSPEVMRTAAHAVAAYETGTITAEQINDLTIDNPEVRTIFELATGVDLAQYNVMKRGKIDEIASNNAMMNGLLANAADNYVQMARAEQKQWSNRTRGRMLNAMSNSFGEKGNLAMHDVLKAVDPRDQQKYLLTARIAQNVYDYARRTDISWDKMKNAYKGSFRNVDIDVMKDVYDAAKMDKDKAETAYLGRQVVAGEAMRFEKSDNGVARVTGEFTNDSARELTGEEDEAMRAVADRLGVNIRIVPDSEMTIDGRMSAGENAENVPHFNGSYDSGTNTILLAETNGLNDNILYAMSHETTHLLKQYAPDAYMKLSNYVMDKFYKSAPGRYEATIKSKQDLYKRAVNQDLSEEAALEEIIADATRDFWSDPEFVNQISNDIEDPGFFKSIVNAIRDMLRHIRNLLSSGHFDGTEHEDVLWDMLGTYSKAEKLWLDAYRQAARNRAQMAIDELQDKANKQNSPRLSVGEEKYSITTDKEDFIKGANLSKDLRDWAKEMGLDKLSKQPIKGPVIVSVRDLRTAWYEKNGRADEAAVINTALDKIGDSLTQLVGKYQYIDLGDALNAAVTYRTDAEGHPTSVILSCQVKNAEYEVNFDFTTICAKRLAMQKILERFIKTEGERQGTTLYDELKLDEEGLYKLRLILETAGFEVSCRGCFVEQNRYSQQNQARTIANDWNKAIDDWEKENNTKVTENFDLVNMDINALNYDEIQDAFNNYSNLMSGRDTNVETKNRTLIEAHPFFRKRMNPSDYASMAGQRALMAIGVKQFRTKDGKSKKGTTLYGLLKRGQSDSKQSVPFTAYNGEIALLPDNMKGKSLYDYLLSIGGARAQSASDFQIEFVYDYMQMVADLSARGLPMHMYTKVIELAELFGMTGIKINLSAMCDVAEDVGGEYAGLKLVDGKYEYNISDQSIDYEKAVELQKRDGYSKNIGIIMVTLSSQHMLKSLDDPDVRYIIGYHSSAMPVVVANMSNMGGATDYTKINKTNKLNEKGQVLFDEAMEEAKGNTELEKYKDALRIFDEKIQAETAKKKKKPRRGNEYGAYMSAYGNNTADFNTYDSLLDTKDARKTADKYLEHCMENDLIPIYFPFAFHENYYKCEVYDFNMYDNNTGEYAPMESVQNIYPGLNMAAGETDTTAFTERVSQMMDERNRLNEALDSQYDAVFDEAKKELKYSISGNDYMDFDASGIDHNELTHRADAPMTAEQQRDADYMDAVNSGNMDEAQRLVDEAAKAAGMKVAHRYHGTMNATFTVFDKAYAKVGGNSGAGFYFSTEKDDSANHYADVEGADNYFKWSSLAEQINDQINEGTWEGPELETYEDVEEYAKEQLNKNPGTYDVYLNYKRPYVRNGRFSTDIFSHLDALFDDSAIDRNDYDSEDDYDDAWREEYYKQISEEIYRAVYAANQDLEDNYEVIYGPYVDEIAQAIAEKAFDYETLTWNDIYDTLYQLGETMVTNYNWSEDADATPEFTRAIIENFGFDAIEDKEVSSKFGQLSREMMTDTEHIIVFKPEQIKLSDPVTYAEDGSVIPLSERFDPTNNDIRYSLPTQDSDGKILTDGQMEYFKNSQARDIFGRLVPVYHGTFRGPRITIFDGSNDGYWFTSNRDVAEDYSMGYEMGVLGAQIGTERNPYDSGDEYFAKKGIRIEQDADGDWRAIINRNGREHYWGSAESKEELIENLYTANENEDLFDSQFTLRDYYPAYLNLENPRVIDCNGSMHDDVNGTGMTTRELAAEAKFDGYDGIIFRNVVDPFEAHDVYVAFSSNQVKDINNENPTADNPDIRYSIPDEDMVKSYIEQNVEDIHDIPLVDFMLEQNRQNLIAAEEAFQANVSERWDRKSELYIAALDDPKAKASLRSIMREVRKDSGTKKQYKSETLEEVLKDVRQMHKYARANNAEMFAKTAWEAAEKIIDDIDYNDDLYEKYVGVKKYLDKARIVVPEEYFYMQDFAEFARSIQGFVRFYADGISLEKAYGQLSKKYPDLFPSDVNNAVDMLMQIADVIDYTIPYRETYSSEEYSSLVEEVASNLCELVENGKDYKTTIEKLKVDAMNQRHQEALRKAEARHQEQLDESNARTETQRQRAEKWKQRYNDRVQKGIKDRKERSEKQDHRKYFTRIQKNYNKLCDWVLKPTKEKNVPEEFRKSLAEFLQTLDLQTENSKKLEAKTGHVGQKTLKLRELKDRLNELAKSKTTEDGDYISGGFELDAYAAYLMDTLSNKYDGKSVDELDALAIRDIDVVLKTIIKNIQRYKQVKTETKMAEISDVGGRGVEFLKNKIDRDGPYSKRKGAPGALQTINATALTPPYLFDRLGPIKEMYDALRHNGFDTYIRNEKMIIDRLSGILGKYNRTNRKGQNMPGSIVEEWRDERSAQTIQLTYGSVTMSVAQMMSLYCLSKRGEQALGHMLVGGIKTTPIQTTSKIAAEEKEKMSKVARLAKRTKNAAGNYVRSRVKGETEAAEKLVLTYDDVQTIISKLTPDQKDVADKLQNLMSVDMARLGNEAHRELYGYEMFDEDFYFPIKVDSNQRETDINTIGEVFEKIKSFGFAKPLTPNANKAIIIDDIFSIVADHCNGMNLYNSYLVPITDFMKVLNYTHTFEDGTTLSMKDAIEQAYGKDMLKYVLNLMKDINGIKAENRGGLEGLMNKAIGKAKKTAVFGNVRVALQQPTAIVRAAMEINPKYLKGVSLPQTVASYAPVARYTSKAMEEMWKYCPIAQWKAWGYYDTYMGKDIEDVMMNNWSIGDDILSGYYGQLDNATWAVIWQAVKAEQADKYPDMDHNSEEFLQICGRRASEVFDKTQVVDSTFHRSDAMRSKQVAVKIFTAFMAEPTLTLNVFRAGLYNFSEEWKAGNKGKASKILGKAVLTIISQGILVSAAQAFADAWRGKDPGLPWGDDDDDEEKAGYWTRWVHNFVYNCFDQLHLENNLYLVKDVTPYINYMISMGADHWNWNPTLRAVMGWDQDYLYSQNNLVFAALENTANGMSQAFKKLEKGDEYVDYKTKEPKRWYDINQKIASGIGTLIGFPAGTVMRDFKPIWDKIFPVVFAADTELMDNIANKMGYRPIGSGSSETTTTESKTEKKAESSGHEAELQNYREGLSDNYSEEQKDKLVKQYEKKLDKESEAAAYEGTDFKGHVQEGITNFEYEMEKRSLKAAENAAGKTGNAKNDALWDVISEGYTKSVASGNMGTIWAMREAFVENGGDADWFDAKITDKMKSEYKKTIGNDPSEAPGSLARQETMRNYMIEHGVTDDEISEIVRKTYTASDLKAAMRMGNEEYIMDELVPLVQAGLTRADFEYLYKYRNYGAKYYNGKYSDPQYKASTGTYVWPTQGTITSTFGYRSAASTNGVGSTNHPAIDIGAPMGSEVVAADGGVIISAGWAGGYGNQVAIKHDDGTITYYSHLSGWNVKVGDQVSQGQQIAQVGSTGNSTGPHLDFKVEKDGEPVDPLQFLDKTNAKYNLDA